LDEDTLLIREGLVLETLIIFGALWVALIILCVLVVAAPPLEEPLRKLVRHVRHPLRKLSS
jgi:hypothetical protein